MRGRLVVGWNILKAWLLVLGGCAVLAAIALPFHEYRLVSLLVFFGLLVAGAAYWYGDRVALGMVGARELPVGENPVLHGTVQRLALAAGLPKPRLYLLPDGHPRALLFVLGPVAAALVHLLLSPKRELAADRAAAVLIGSPHGLADALIRLEQAAELVEFRANPATEPLYTFNPFAEEGLAALFVTHPPVGERVRRLRELDPAWRDKLRAA